MISGVFFFKDEIFKPGQVSAWDFVPSNAVSVWESKSTIKVWNRFTETSIWSTLESIPAFGLVYNDLVYLDIHLP